jgi:MFS family permease
MYHSSLASWFAIAPLAIGIILGQACYAGSITFEVALEKQGTISGITTAIYTLALCISILLSGLLCTINIRLPFLCSGLSSLLLMLYLLKNKKHFRS